MEEFPPKFSKVLVTPDPQYIPGYAGYCPQLKFTIGESYGKLTARLLSNPEVSRDRQLILYNSNAPSVGKDAEPPGEVWASLPGVRRHPECMIPGYKGFIPNSRNCFSRTYTQTCKEALSEFQQDLRKRMIASANRPRVDSGAAPQPTLTPVTNESVPYKIAPPWKPLASPYVMEENNPNKCFISGFTGFVPKSRFLFGTGFPVTTNRALIQFDKEARGKDGVLPQRVEEFPTVTSIYPSYSGMVPAYTGHVPGYRFTFGQTFGQLTRNALGSISASQGR